MGMVERVRALAEKNGQTIASVERELGFGQGSIRNWNKAAPASDKLYKVAQMFDVTMEYILTGTDAKKADSEFEGIGVDGLRAGLLWEQLDEPGRAIVLGDIYKRLEGPSREADSAADAGRRAGRVG